MRRSVHAPRRRFGLAVLALCFVGPLAAAGHPLVGREAPDFALKAIEGPNVRLSEFRGQVVLLAFWGSRCNPCRGELAELARVQGTYGPAGLAVLGVSVDDDAARAREFAQAVEVSFPMLGDPAKDVGRDYDVDALPLLVLIDRRGIVRHVQHASPARGEAPYVEPLRRLLDE